MQPAFTEFDALFLDGPAGAGKTTAAVARIRALLDAGVAPESVLLITPQRSYTRAYEPAFTPAEWYRLEKATIGGLARRYVELFWPEVAPTDGFSLDRPPHFLTYEQAQYFMAAVVQPLIERGAFAGTRLTRPRLYSQLLDNLNKAAAHGLDLDRLPAFLDDVAIGEKSGGGMTGDIMAALEGYRAHCRAHSLVDFASYLTLFVGIAGEDTAIRRHLLARYRHLVVDNLEEDVPVAHDLIAAWLPSFESALLVADTEGSYRLFMGASARSAGRLAARCDRHETREIIHTAPPALQAFGEALRRAIRRDAAANQEVAPAGDAASSVTVYVDRLHHGMIDRAAACVGRLTDAGVPPGEIAVIAPMLGDNVHYALTLQLEKMGIASYAHRPSRLLYDEPVTRVMLTLAAFAHPAWEAIPHREAATLLFYRVLGGCDLVRASLLAGAVVPTASEGVALLPFEAAPAGVRDRVSYQIGEAYEGLRAWVEAYAAGEPAPIDHFFSRAFGELLSQPGYGFHRGAAEWQVGAVEAGKLVGALVESAARFRGAAAGMPHASAGKAYRDMVQEGVISAFYAFEWDEPADAVLLAPVHTFLLRNRPVRAQLWLDVGSTAWHRRINQPLTNPYILNREWTPGSTWDDRQEHSFELERLTHAALGLIRRCTGELHLFVSSLSATGRDQKGLLLQALSRAARQVPVDIQSEA
ncbi:MAG: AAA family ATPase [Rhodothermales bacterium]